MVVAGDCVNAIAGLAAQAVAQTDWLGERSTPIILRLQTAIRGCRVSLASDRLALSGCCSTSLLQKPAGRTKADGFAEKISASRKPQ
jgi:hypothetical protein